MRSARHTRRNMRGGAGLVVYDDPLGVWVDAVVGRVVDDGPAVARERAEGAVAWDLRLVGVGAIQVDRACATRARSAEYPY